MSDEPAFVSLHTTCERCGRRVATPIASDEAAQRDLELRKKHHDDEHEVNDP